MDLTEVAIAFGAGLSLVSQLTMIYGYLKLKRMRMYPELLIFWQNLSQVILSLHWLSGLPSVFSFVSPACKEIGAVFLYFYYLCFNVILFLSIEIVIKLKYPLNCCYKSRVRTYKVLSQLVCIPCFIILITADNNDGVSIFGTCFVQHNTIYELFVFAPLVIHTPICLVLSFYTFWNTLGRKHGKNLRYHNYVVITFCFCWGFGALLHALSYFNVRETQTEILITMIILEAPCGFYIFIARISQKGLFAKIFKRTTKKKRPEINLSTQKLPFIESYSINCTNESFFLVNTFEKITIEAAVDTLSGFTKFFSFCQKSPKVNDEEFKVKFKLTNNKEISIHSFHSNYFMEIMKVAGVDYKKLLESFDVSQNLKGLNMRCKSIGGKSGAFFYFTQNKEFIIKSVNKKELKVLENIIEAYCLRQRESANCLLTKIFGAFKVKINKSGSRFLVIMENLLKNFENPLIFDLKGSTDERQSSSESYEKFDLMPKNVVYKDLDFLNSFDHKKKFKVCKDLMNSLEIDSKLLESFDIMDYSLLLIVEEFQPNININESLRFVRVGKYWCCLGIIDFFQNYSKFKKFETNFNRFKKNDPNQCSCIPPKAYRERFLMLMKNIFMNSPSSTSESHLN